MTRKFQIVAQLLATFAQTMMHPMEKYFGWGQPLTEMLHAAISFGQLALGIIAHGYTPEGDKIPQHKPEGGE